MKRLLVLVALATGLISHAYGQTYPGQVPGNTVLGNSTGSPVPFAVPGAVTNSQMATVPATTLKCNTTASPATPQDCTTAQVASTFQGGVCYVDGTHFTTLSAALSACTSNVTIYVAASQSISTNLTISGANTEIRCINGAVLNLTTGGLLLLTGQGDGIRDCGIVGPGTGNAGNGAIRLQNTNQYLYNNTITSFGSSGDNGIVRAPSGGVSFLSIQGNTIVGNADLGILINTSTSSSHINISNNYVGNGVWGVPAASTSFTDIVINNNNLDYASGGISTSIGLACIQWLAGNSGASIATLQVNGNTCTLGGNTITGHGDEAYGIAQVTNFNISNNIAFYNGFNSFDFGIEINASSDGVVSNNTLKMGTSTLDAINCENCVNVAIANNIIDGFGTTSSSNGILFQTTSTAPTGNAAHSTITGNVIAFPSSGAGAGIKVLCNFTGSICSDFIVANNDVVSDGTVGSIGVLVAQSVGTIAQFTIGPNNLRAPATGTEFTGTIGVYCYIKGFSTNATNPGTIAANATCT